LPLLALYEGSIIAVGMVEKKVAAAKTAGADAADAKPAE
jgi:sec-independent protein translocase protein TatC